MFEVEQCLPMYEIVGNSFFFVKDTVITE